MILLHYQSFSLQGVTIITYFLLACLDAVSCLGQNLPYYDVCLFRAQYREDSEASKDSQGLCRAAVSKEMSMLGGEV